MGVEQRYGTGYREPGSLDAIDSIYRCAEIRAVNSTVVCGDGDEPGSRYFVGYLPTSGMLESGSLIAWDATGLTAVSLGFKDNPNAFGTFDMSKADAVMIADLAVPAGTRELPPTDPGPQYGISNLDEHFWQQANHARDPGGELDLILTIDAGQSIADAKIKVVLKFFRQG